MWWVPLATTAAGMLMQNQKDSKDAEASARAAEEARRYNAASARMSYINDFGQQQVPGVVEHDQMGSLLKGGMAGFAQGQSFAQTMAENDQKQKQQEMQNQELELKKQQLQMQQQQMQQQQSPYAMLSQQQAPQPAQQSAYDPWQTPNYNMQPQPQPQPQMQNPNQNPYFLLQQR